MAGMLTYLGGVTIGDCLPAFAGVYAGVLGELQAKVAGLLALQAQLTVNPPTLVGQLQLVQQLVVALQAAIAIGLPGVDFQLAAVAQAIVGIEAQLALLVGIEVALGTAGVHAFSYDGDVVSLGLEISSTGIPGSAPADHCNALLLAATAPAVWMAMGQVFIQ